MEQPSVKSSNRTIVIKGGKSSVTWPAERASHLARLTSPAMRLADALTSLDFILISDSFTLFSEVPVLMTDPDSHQFIGTILFGS